MPRESREACPDQGFERGRCGEGRLLFFERVTTALGRDRALAFRYLPIAFRKPIAGLFQVDGAMGDVVRTTREPMVGQICLAWWRERLEELDEGRHAPAEPRLQAVERYLLPQITGHDVADLEPGWLRLLAPFPWTEETSEAIWLRGNRLFGLAARLLGERDDHLQSAGGLWALVDVASLQRQTITGAPVEAGSWLCQWLERYQVPEASTATFNARKSSKF